MSNKWQKLAAGLGTFWLTLGVYVGTAYADADQTAVSSVTSGATTLKDTLVAVATAVLPFAAAILAIVFGWRMVRRFVRA